MQSLEDIPQYIATAWNIDLIASQIIISIAVLMACILPVIILRAGSKTPSFNFEIVTGFMGLALCVGLGWLHYWIIIVVIMLLAFFTAVLGADVVFGTKGGGGGGP